jgi:general secretion pathway protein E
LPNGILLVTGPTGSGKTTTLYTGLTNINAVSRNIVTVEDPIEYQLQGINQTQIKPQIGLNFAAMLRSILRQDPDVIMVGEIRDLETAQIAVQAALTGIWCCPRCTPIRRPRPLRVCAIWGWRIIC